MENTNTNSPTHHIREQLLAQRREINDKLARCDVIDRNYKELSGVSAKPKRARSSALETREVFDKCLLMMPSKFDISQLYRKMEDNGNTASQTTVRRLLEQTVEEGKLVASVDQRPIIYSKPLAGGLGSSETLAPQKYG